MMAEQLKDIRIQFEELRLEYPGLSLSYNSQEIFLIQGMLDFTATYNEVPIEDVFDIAMLIPKDFPRSIPEVWETGGRIPRDHHTYDHGGLCLGALLAIRMTIAQDPSLKAYVKDLVIPYLYSFRYKELYKEMPYGELSHGGQGILEYYCNLFNTTSHQVVIGFLELLAGKYRGHHLCPCGTGLKIRNCHGSLLQELSTYMGKEAFAYELVHCKKYLDERQKKVDQIAPVKPLYR